MAEPLVEREEGRLHGLHEEAVVASGDGENFRELPLVQGGLLLAEDVLASFKGFYANSRVGVGMRGYVDGVYAGGDKQV